MRLCLIIAIHKDLCKNINITTFIHPKWIHFPNVVLPQIFHCFFYFILFVSPPLYTKWNKINLILLPSLFLLTNRYFVLTRDYLHCFKRATGSATERISDMGQFIFKVSRVAIKLFFSWCNLLVNFISHWILCGCAYSIWVVKRKGRKKMLFVLYIWDERDENVCLG